MLGQAVLTLYNVSLRESGLSLRWEQLAHTHLTRTYTTYAQLSALTVTVSQLARNTMDGRFGERRVS